MEHNQLEGSVIPFARRWHVVQEIDLIPLMQAHRSRAALCDRLEAIADALPSLPAPEERDAICQQLLETAALEERDEMPFLNQMLVRSSPEPFAAALIEHVRRGNASDAYSAFELVAMLRPSPIGEKLLSAEALGYLLRGFFNGCRRAIEFEQLAILALAAHRLTKDARALLVDRFVERVAV
ncbi:hypothetical protein HL653_16280 [Sphingomonas sp. AP4-R1]|uniref:hypothetical protein n=1 Tax=Sphingomonas sp. AP4-R1 TaxID=2735134 RepID=UPI001493BCEA|nr:hypothetical protein [Sphingomonas sp. AP4-R1]QJU59108.1 hypothetical protein HL653_16280 [Sphingomonas sp. AP4-R1]